MIIMVCVKMWGSSVRPNSLSSSACSSPYVFSFMSIFVPILSDQGLVVLELLIFVDSRYMDEVVPMTRAVFIARARITA